MQAAAAELVDIHRVVPRLEKIEVGLLRSAGVQVLARFTELKELAIGVGARLSTSTAWTSTTSAEAPTEEDVATGRSVLAQLPHLTSFHLLRHHGLGAGVDLVPLLAGSPWLARLAIDDPSVDVRFLQSEVAHRQLTCLSVRLASFTPSDLAGVLQCTRLTSLELDFASGPLVMEDYATALAPPTVLPHLAHLIVHAPVALAAVEAKQQSAPSVAALPRREVFCWHASDSMAADANADSNARRSHFRPRAK